MKKQFYLIILIIISFSCKGNAVDPVVVEAYNVNDSLRYIIDQRDSIINDALTTIADIAISLEDVNRQENIVTQSSEYGVSNKDQIKEDLQVLSSLLAKNRRRIAQLEKSTEQLSSANIKIDGLTKLIDQLNVQIKEKDIAINAMLADIDGLKEEVSGLTDKVVELESDKEVLENEVVEKVNNLNEAYYIVGEEKDLISRGVLQKMGTIGRTLVVNPNINRDQLVKIDIRSVDRIDVKGSKAKIVGSFPSDSYTLQPGDERNLVDALIITDKSKFWSNDRILVISYR